MPDGGLFVVEGTLNSMFNDLCDRLDQLADDIIDNLDEEVFQIKRAIERSAVDHKHPGKVLAALRIPWLKAIHVDFDTNDVTVGASNGEDFIDMYEGMFDNFMYDIGHGKGSGEGSLD